MDKELDIEGYKSAVEDYAKEHKNYVFHNYGCKHASIIFKNIFENATDFIRIAADKLCDNDVVDTSEYISGVKKFLQHDNAQLRILITNYDANVIRNKETSFLKELAMSPAFTEGRVIVKNGNGKHFKFMTPSHKPISVDFTTADSHMYRVETDIEKKAAICNFGDECLTKSYEDIFDDVFNNKVKEEDVINLMDLLQ